MERRSKALAKSIKKHGSENPEALCEELLSQNFPENDPFIRKLREEIEVKANNKLQGASGRILPLIVDDVTRLNATEVERVFYPRNDDDVKDVLALARQHNKIVSVRGTRHSMGAHTFSKDCYVLDLLNLNQYEFDANECLLTTGPGALWSDLILYLNQFGFSPRTMQSYSTFSVGGSLSVNAHGITTDYPVSECVDEFKLIKWDGSEVICKKNGEGESSELFSLALGGYGMFGIIVQVKMKVNVNMHIEMEMIQTDVKSFPNIYDSLLAQDDIEIKLARVDVTNPSEIDIFVFRRNCLPGVKTVSKLELQPREMSIQSQLLYKWVLPSAKAYRGLVERSTGKALDWNTENERNLLMYESADPLANLYESLLVVDDTFVLQEYFVPKNKFIPWMNKAKAIYKSLRNDDNSKPLHLLNTTIRFVKKDNDTYLSYSRFDQGVFAFVLYYRMRRNKKADKELEKIHQAFVKITLDLSGTFYLPYRHHYSEKQMDEAYPMIKDFFALKQKYDPRCMFQSKWFQRYGMRFCTMNNSMNGHVSEYGRLVDIDMSEKKKKTNRQRINAVVQRRDDSYGRLLGHLELRRRFREEFLVNIFNSMDNEELFRLIRQAWLENANRGDKSVFMRLQELVTYSSSNTALVFRLYRQLMQLNHQKLELERQTRQILTNLGRIKNINGFVSIGDSGKLVRLLKEGACSVSGKTYVCNHVNPDKETNDGSGVVPASVNFVVERASEMPVGEFVEFDYEEDFSLDPIPSCSIDLVTMNAGLHHFAQDKIPQVLSEVFRILRPSGVFLLREHDANDDLIPLLDLAHSVFNVLTGVSAKGDEEEIRAFRPLTEWRSIVRECGFVDTMLFEMEKGDPTKDVMLAFVKPPFLTRRDLQNLPLCFQEEHGNVHFRSLSMSITQQLGLEGMKLAFPVVVLDAIRNVIDSLKGSLSGFENYVLRIIDTSGLSDGQKYAAQMLLNRVIRPGKSLTESLGVAFGEHVQIKDNVDMGVRFPFEEIYLIIHNLLKKGEAGNASAEELTLIALIKDIAAFFRGFEADDAESSGLDTTAAEIEKEKNVDSFLDGPSKEEKLKDVVHRLFESFPELTAADLADSGFPVIIAKLNLFQHRHQEKLVQSLCEKLDDMAVLELEAAVRSLIGQKEIGESGVVKFTFSNIKNDKSPWHDVTMAILGAPKIHFTTLGKFQANSFGLGDIITMWGEAQRRRRMVNEGTDESLFGNVDWNHPRDRRTAEVTNALNALSGSSVPYTTSFTIGETDGASINVDSVSDIVSAKLTAQSPRLSPLSNTYDCTEIVRDFIQRDGRLILDLTEEFIEEVLNSNSNTLIKIGRRVAGRVFSGDAYRLDLEIKTDSKLNPQTHLAKVRALIGQLEDAGVVQDLHSNDGEFTWYKLSEWMQVEILSIFRNTLDHTPWYRFPFMDMLTMYFRVLMKESEIVREKHGVQKAYFGMAFITDVIPGIIMAFLFGQLKLLAFPLKSSLGNSYNEESLYEEMIIKLDGKENLDWRRMDPRIRKVRRIVSKLYAVECPTFKGMTEVLKKFSEYREIEILQISNNNQCQVRVEVSDEEQIRLLKEIPGVEVMFQFKYPVDGSPNEPLTSVSLCVDIPFLLHLFRYCKNYDILVLQVYDWWN